MQPYFYKVIYISFAFVCHNRGYFIEEPIRGFISFCSFLVIPVSLRMILYNISVIVEDSSHHKVIQWLKSHLRASNYETTLLKMLDSPHEGNTYCVQFLATDHAAIVKFQEDVVAELQTYLATNHTEKAFIFDSKMQYLSLE